MPSGLAKKKKKKITAFNLSLVCKRKTQSKTLSRMTDELSQTLRIAEFDL